MRNVLAHAGRQGRRLVSAFIATAFAQDDAEGARAVRRGETSVAPDDEGADFASIEEAYLETFKGAQELWPELLRNRQDPRQYAFEITDRDGAVVMELPPVRQKMIAVVEDFLRKTERIVSVVLYASCRRLSRHRDT
jgi:hypothetical protein